MFIFACFNSSWFIRLDGRYSAVSVKQVLDFHENSFYTSERRKKQRRRLFTYFDKKKKKKKKGQTRSQADARKPYSLSTNTAAPPRQHPLAEIMCKCSSNSSSSNSSSSSSFCLFDLILYVPSTIFQLHRDVSSWVEPVLS